MTSSVFPDINVWLALSYPEHQHNIRATNWLLSEAADAKLVFSRHTQLGLFRLLTTTAVLGENVRTQKQCWQLYDEWVNSGKAVFRAEPSRLEQHFRDHALADSASPKVWADAYLAAFSIAADLQLVTFDRALAGKAEGAMLLS